MLDWIAGYVGRWSGEVVDATRSLVQWGLHALASVVYTVFGNVGKAWGNIIDTIADLYTEARNFATEVAHTLYWIVHLYVLPLVNRLTADFHTALTFAESVLKYARLAIDAVNHALAAGLQDVRTWADRNIFAPLTAAIKTVEANLIKWGLFAYDLLTHPEKLAPLLIRALITAAEDIFWDIAAPIGEFAFRIVVKDLNRWLKLAETIIAAVL